MSKIIQLSDGTESLFPRTANGTLSSTDALDSINREGTYWCTSVGGRPQTTNANAFLIVWTYGTNILQVYIPYATSGVPAIYIRYAVGGTWRAWKQVATSAV